MCDLDEDGLHNGLFEKSAQQVAMSEHGVKVTTAFDHKIYVSDPFETFENESSVL